MNRTQQKILHLCLELAKLALTGQMDPRQAAKITAAVKTIVDTL